MVQANELRIGNYISYKNERWIKVGYHEIRYAVLYPDTSYYPIPLTFEILEKAGFELQIGMMSWEKEGVIICYETIANFFRLYPMTNRINYVHQLQNLYYALTGEELEVNLSVVVARGTI